MCELINKFRARIFLYVYYLPSTQNEDMWWGWTGPEDSYRSEKRNSANKILSLRQRYIEIYDTRNSCKSSITAVLLLSARKRESISISLSKKKKERRWFFHWSSSGMASNADCESRGFLRYLERASSFSIGKLSVGESRRGATRAS